MDTLQLPNKMVDGWWVKPKWVWFWLSKPQVSSWDHFTRLWERMTWHRCLLCLVPSYLLPLPLFSVSITSERHRKKMCWIMNLWWKGQWAEQGVCVYSGSAVKRRWKNRVTRSFLGSLQNDLGLQALWWFAWLSSHFNFSGTCSWGTEILCEFQWWKVEAGVYIL